MYNSHAGAYYKVEKIPRQYSNEHHIEHSTRPLLSRTLPTYCPGQQHGVNRVARLKCILALERLEGLGPSSDLVLDLGILAYLFFFF